MRDQQERIARKRNHSLPAHPPGLKILELNVIQVFAAHSPDWFLPSCAAVIAANQ
jgi:hypothetical protein